MLFPSMPKKRPACLLRPGCIEWIKEHISIHNPFHTWGQESETFNADHESLHYQYTKRAEGENMEIDYEIKLLKDHIPLNSLQDYWISRMKSKTFA